MRVIIGLVGTCSFVDDYPLGRLLVERIRSLEIDGYDLEVEDMNWSPVAISQALQSKPVQPERVVLVGPSDRGLPLDSVSCRKWAGGSLDPLALQDRVFEAVTGVVCLDNLLIIGEHFGVWPKEVTTVELQLEETALGDMVLEDLAHGRTDVGRRPASARVVDLVDELVERTREAACGSTTDAALLSASSLTARADVVHHAFFEARSEQP